MEPPQTVRPVRKDITVILIMDASNAIKYVKLVMEELPQTVRFAQKDIIKMVIVVAESVIQYVYLVMEPQIVRLV